MKTNRNNLKRTIAGILAVLTVGSSLPASVFTNVGVMNEVYAANIQETTYFDYEIDGNKFIIYAKSDDGIIDIPNQNTNWDGYSDFLQDMTAAMEGNPNCTEFVIGSNVKTINFTLYKYKGVSYYNGFFDDMVLYAKCSKDVVAKYTKLSCQEGCQLANIPMGLFAATQPFEVIDLSNCSELTTIESYAFYDDGSSETAISPGIKEIHLPSNLTTIGDYAFYGEKNTIEALDFSNCSSLQKIGSYAFSGGNSTIEVLDLSNCSSLTHILECAFEGWTIKELHLPSTIEVLSKYAFTINDGKTHTNLQDVYIPRSYKSGLFIFGTCFAFANQIGEDGKGVRIHVPAYKEDSYIKNFDASSNKPSGFKYQMVPEKDYFDYKVEGDKFIIFASDDEDGEVGLSTDFILNQLKAAMEENPNCTEFVIGSNVKTIKYSAGSTATGLFGKLYEKGLSEDIINNYTKLSVEDGSQLELIPAFLFSAYYSLFETVDLSNSQIKEIGQNSFYNSGTQKLYLPSTITKIGGAAFANAVTSPAFTNNALTDVYIDVSDAYTIFDIFSNGSFTHNLGENGEGVVFHVPKGTESAYESALADLKYHSDEFEYKIEESEEEPEEAYGTISFMTYDFDDYSQYECKVKYSYDEETGTLYIGMADDSQISGIGRYMPGVNRDLFGNGEGGICQSLINEGYDLSNLEHLVFEEGITFISQYLIDNTPFDNLKSIKYPSTLVELGYSMEQWVLDLRHYGDTVKQPETEFCRSIYLEEVDFSDCVNLERLNRGSLSYCGDIAATSGAVCKIKEIDLSNCNSLEVISPNALGNGYVKTFIMPESPENGSIMIEAQGLFNSRSGIGNYVNVFLPKNATPGYFEFEHLDSDSFKQKYWYLDSRGLYGGSSPFDEASVLFHLSGSSDADDFEEAWADDISEANYIGFVDEDSKTVTLRYEISDDKLIINPAYGQSFIEWNAETLDYFYEILIEHPEIKELVIGRDVKYIKETELQISTNYFPLEGNENIEKISCEYGSKLEGIITIEDIGGWHSIFEKMLGLTTVDFSNSKLEEINDCLFEECYNLKEVYLPDTVKSFGDAAFDPIDVESDKINVYISNPNPEEINWLAGEFGFFAFDDIYNIELHVPAGTEDAYEEYLKKLIDDPEVELCVEIEVSAIGDYPPYDAPSYVYNSENNTLIISGNGGSLKDVYTYIDEHKNEFSDIYEWDIFGGKYVFDKIIVQGEFSDVAENAFSKKEISVGDFEISASEIDLSKCEGLTTIKDGAFKNVELKKLVLPGSIENVGENIFNMVLVDFDIYFNNYGDTIEQLNLSENMFGEYNHFATIKVPNGTYDAYETEFASVLYRDYRYTIKERADFSIDFDEETKTLTITGNGKLSDVAEYVKEKYPELCYYNEWGDLYIGQDASGEILIDKVVINGGFTEIGTDTFSIPGKTEYDAASVFRCNEMDLSNCYNLTDIDDYAFRNCSFEKIVFPPFVINFGRYIFNNNSALFEAKFKIYMTGTDVSKIKMADASFNTTYGYPGGTIIVPETTAGGYQNLINASMEGILHKYEVIEGSYVVIGDTVYYFGSGEFDYVEFMAPFNDGGVDINDIKNIVIGSQYTSIGDLSDGCINSIETITFEENSQLEKIENDAFKNWTNLKNIDFSNCYYLWWIGSYAFYGCNITSYDFSSTELKYVGDYCFGNNTDIDFVFPMIQIDFGNNVFDGTTIDGLYFISNEYIIDDDGNTQEISEEYIVSIISQAETVKQIETQPEFVEYFETIDLGTIEIGDDYSTKYAEPGYVKVFFDLKWIDGQDKSHKRMSTMPDFKFCLNAGNFKDGSGNTAISVKAGVNVEENMVSEGLSYDDPNSPLNGYVYDMDKIAIKFPKTSENNQYNDGENLALINYFIDDCSVMNWAMTGLKDSDYEIVLQDGKQYTVTKDENGAITFHMVLSLKFKATYYDVDGKTILAETTRDYYGEDNTMTAESVGAILPADLDHEKYPSNYYVDGWMDLKTGKVYEADEIYQYDFADVEFMPHITCENRQIPRIYFNIVSNKNNQYVLGSKFASKFGAAMKGDYKDSIKVFKKQDDIKAGEDEILFGKEAYNYLLEKDDTKKDDYFFDISMVSGAQENVSNARFEISTTGYGSSEGLIYNGEAQMFDAAAGYSAFCDSTNYDLDTVINRKSSRDPYFDDYTQTSQLRLILPADEYREKSLYVNVYYTIDGKEYLWSRYCLDIDNCKEFWTLADRFIATDMKNRVLSDDGLIYTNPGQNRLSSTKFYDVSNGVKLKLNEGYSYKVAEYSNADKTTCLGVSDWTEGTGTAVDYIPSDSNCKYIRISVKKNDNSDMKAKENTGLTVNGKSKTADFTNYMMDTNGLLYNASAAINRLCDLQFIDVSQIQKITINTDDNKDYEYCLAEYSSADKNSCIGITEWTSDTTSNAEIKKAKYVRISVKRTDGEALTAADWKEINLQIYKKM